MLIVIAIVLTYPSLYPLNNHKLTHPRTNKINKIRLNKNKKTIHTINLNMKMIHLLMNILLIRIQIGQKQQKVKKYTINQHLFPGNRFQ